MRRPTAKRLFGLRLYFCRIAFRRRPPSARINERCVAVWGAVNSVGPFLDADTHVSQIELACRRFDGNRGFMNTLVRQGMRRLRLALAALLASTALAAADGILIDAFEIGGASHVGMSRPLLN